MKEVLTVAGYVLMAPLVLFLAYALLTGVVAPERTWERDDYIAAVLISSFLFGVALLVTGSLL